MPHFELTVLRPNDPDRAYGVTLTFPVYPTERISGIGVLVARDLCRFEADALIRRLRSELNRATPAIQLHTLETVLDTLGLYPVRHPSDDKHYHAYAC